MLCYILSFVEEVIHEWRQSREDKKGRGPTDHCVAVLVYTNTAIVKLKMMRSTITLTQNMFLPATLEHRAEGLLSVYSTHTTC